MSERGFSDKDKNMIGSKSAKITGFSQNARDGFFLFSFSSDLSLKRARINFNNSFVQIAMPYYDLTSNVKAIGHPFFHATQLLRNAGRFVYGAFVLIGAIATGNLDAADKTAFGMLKLLGAAALEILNIALSIVSLATRFVASIFNVGYVSTRARLNGGSLNDAECGGHNEKIFRGMLQKINLDTINFKTDEHDKIAHHTAFELI